ncbi:DUF559 domain-containing protein [Herbiconiux sp. CPCC 205763]|uniref:DUF559 domain-containing protein n=1 Tax=Herbiconiux aconitum TaxID=2970913 RepID=A0ABT2GKE9_9MICO|nr:type IV toxin-antitoxin system AbiEi family antitoxin domain-containing protein [Herbiconiux aconitum]MCS5716694.1 DUF559 domain-containing protein [Herbiconiux aconitum]
MPSAALYLPEFSTPRSLQRLGIAEQRLRSLRRDGSLVRVRQGVYARPDARSQLVRAVRLGGSLTAHSALNEWGAWCPPGDERLHVAVDAHARALRDPDTGAPFVSRSDVVVHWKSATSFRDPSPPGIVALPRAVRHLPASLEHAHVVAVLDSAVRRRLCTTAQLAAEFETAPRLARALRRVDPRAESGTESVTRVRLLEVGIEADLQVKIGVHRVDLLIAGRLIIEVDGKEFHDTESTFESDRRRDTELAYRGYRVLRFSYTQVLYAWPTCLAAIRAALAAL